MIFKPSALLSFITIASLSSGALAGGWGGTKNGDSQGGNGWNPPPPPPPPGGNPPPPPPPPGNPPPPPGGWQPTPPPPNNGWYPPPKGQTVQLHPNYNWKKCLDVKDGNFYNGAPVDIYDCNGGAGQNWIINQGSTRVQVAGQNFCLDAGDWPNDGTKMKIWNCYDGLQAQSWFYTDDKRIALKDRGFCLDLTNGDTCNGNIMQIWSCTNWNANQIWTT